MNKKDEVYNFLVDRLINAHYAFGERIFVKELVTEMGVSRQPVMTALSRLDGEGFVEIIPQVGCQVVNPNPQEIADFFLMFMKLDGLLARLAAARWTSGQLRKLKSIQTAISALNSSNDDLSNSYAELNRAFHNTIHEMSHSPLLKDRQQANFNMADFFITHSIGFEQLRDEGQREHERIIEALERRASESAGAFAEEHLDAVRQTVLSKSTSGVKVA